METKLGGDSEIRDTRNSKTNHWTQCSAVKQGTRRLKLSLTTNQLKLLLGDSLKQGCDSASKLIKTDKQNSVMDSNELAQLATVELVQKQDRLAQQLSKINREEEQLSYTTQQSTIKTRNPAKTQ